MSPLHSYFLSMASVSFGHTHLCTSGQERKHEPAGVCLEDSSSLSGSPERLSLEHGLPLQSRVNTCPTTAHSTQTGVPESSKLPPLYSLSTSDTEHTTRGLWRRVRVEVHLRCRCYLRGEGLTSLPKPALPDPGLTWPQNVPNYLSEDQQSPPKTRLQ